MRPIIHPRPTRTPRDIHRAAGPIPIRRSWSPPDRQRPVAVAAFAPAEPSPACYLDYARSLTAEGGILIVYKDLDLRWRHTLWRLFAWTTATGGEGWLLRLQQPVHGLWLTLLLFLIMGVINWLIVRPPVEIYRRIEIRPDCLILDGADVFWLEHMDSGLPTLQPDDDDNLILTGIYGTRLVDYATLRRFDEFDRSPEVFGAHLHMAMQQLWSMA